MGVDAQSKTLIADGGNIFYTDYHDETPAVAIARGISAVEGVPIEIIPPLHNYVEVDSMNQMMETARDTDQEITVNLTVEDYKISIESDGTLCIRDFGSSNNQSESK